MRTRVLEEIGVEDHLHTSRPKGEGSKPSALGRGERSGERAEQQILSDELRLSVA
jgi:hypothetical protein